MTTRFCVSWYRPCALAIVLALTLTAGLLPAPATAQAPAVGAVIYVDKDAAPGGDGASWATAYKYLQDALAAAGDGAELWLAEGVYYPDEGAAQTAGDPGQSFALTASAAGLSLYGGFMGAETSRNQADPSKYVTVLSGDIDRNDTTDGKGVTTSYAGIVGSNAHLIVTCASQPGLFVFDGLVISGGSNAGKGAGIRFEFCSLALRRSAVVGNRTQLLGEGGGLFFEGGSGQTLAIANATFGSNFAGLSGGGVYIHRPSKSVASATVKDTLFEDNHAEESNPNCMPEISGGGAIHTTVNIMDVEGATFRNNQTNCAGGAILQTFSGILKIRNSVFIGNRSVSVSYNPSNQDGSGGAIYTWGRGTLVVESSLVAGNHADRDGGGISDVIGGKLIGVTVVGAGAGAGSNGESPGCSRVSDDAPGMIGAIVVKVAAVSADSVGAPHEPQNLSPSTTRSPH